MTRIAQENARAAEVDMFIDFNTLDAQDTRPNGEKGIVVSNPPYGVRLAEVQALHALYPQLGSWLKQHYAGWTIGLLSGDMEMPKLMRLKPKRKIPCLMAIWIVVCLCWTWWRAAIAIKRKMGFQAA